MISKVTNMTIKDTRNNLNQANASDVQVQFADNPAGKTHQNLLSIRMISTLHEEMIVLGLLAEPCIGTNNQPVLTISTGVVQAPKELNLPTM